MQKNICFIGDKNENILPYLDTLREREYNIHINNYKFEKFISKLQRKKIKLILIYHDGASDEFYEQLSKLCSAKKTVRYLQRLPILLVTFSKIDKRKFLAHKVDDIIVLPDDDLANKISSWMYITEEKQGGNTWNKRTFILEDKLESIRQNLRRGNFGLAISNLTQVQTVLETFPTKQDEVSKLAIILEAISVFIEKGQALPLISQINAIEINPTLLLSDAAIDEILTPGEKSRAKEEMTRALSLEEFKEYREQKQAQDEDKSSQKEQAENGLEVRSEDASFARVLLEKRIISKQQLENALREQLDIQKKGEILPLCNIMLMNNAIVPKDIIRVFGEDAITNFICLKCSINYRVLNLAKEPAENFHCRKCKSSLHETIDSGEIFVIPASCEQLQIPSIDADEVTKENIPWCLDKAALLAKNKQIDEALSIYNKILDIDPKNELCRIGRSRLFIENKAYGNAIDEANEVLVHNPENYQSLCHRGVARYYTGELNHCIKDLSILVKKGLHNFMSYSTRGKAYYHKKKYTKAIADLSEAISRAPDFVKGYIYRGRAHLHLRNYKEAIDDLQKTLDINPQYSNRNEVLQLIEIAQQKIEEKQDE